MTDQVNEGTAPEQGAGTQQVTFTPDDLIQAVLVLDEAANEGAFKGWENQQKALHARQRLVMFAQHWQATIDEASKNTLDEVSKGAAPAATPMDKEETANG